MSLPDGIRTIRGDAFFDCTLLGGYRYLGGVILPASVTAIGQWAFRRCALLRTMKLRRGIQIIHEYAFAECHLLGYLSVPSKALVVTQADARQDIDFQLVTDRIISRTDAPQVVIISKCFNSMSSVDIS